MTGPAERPSVLDALAMVRASVRPLGHEVIPVEEALGRIAAAPVHAQVDGPRFDSSAMDGYALRSAETADATAEAPVRFAVSAHVRAGQSALELEPGCAASIATGAPIPRNVDCVLPVERARRDGDAIIVDHVVAQWRNVRKVGEDAGRGDVLLTAGTRISADMIGALVNFDVRTLPVQRVPRLALLTTGDELLSAAAEVRSGTIRDSNGPMIAAAVRDMGLHCARLGQVADRPDAVDDALNAALESDADILMSVGGVSIGRHDLIRAGLERRNAKIRFHGVRMRPGKPLLLAVLPDGRPFFGLPGNPVAAYVAFRFFVTEAIRGMLELPPESGMSMPAPNLNLHPGSTHFLRASMAEGRVRVLQNQRSHCVMPLMVADHWLVCPEGGASGRLFEKSHRW